MKTRTGFVSNSSSSSFIAVATEDAFEEALSQMTDEREKKIVKYLAKKRTCLGQKVRVVKEFTDAGGFSSVWGCDSDNESDILEKVGIEQPEDEDADDQDWYPQDSLFTYTQILDEMATKPEWKNKIFSEDVGDEG